jgi:hypothetical protein
MSAKAMRLMKAATSGYRDGTPAERGGLGIAVSFAVTLAAALAAVFTRRGLKISTPSEPSGDKPRLTICAVRARASCSRAERRESTRTNIGRKED